MAAEFGGRTFFVAVGFRHLFRGLIGDRCDRQLSCARGGFAGKTSHMVKTSKSSATELSQCAFFMLAFWVAEFGGQDRLAPAK
jgi:hypothetical protein